MDVISRKAMFNKLRGRIVEKEGTQRQFAEKMNLSKQTLSLKLNGKREWKQCEIEKACTILDINNADIPGYFFNYMVKKTESGNLVEVVRCKECKHMIPQSNTRYCTVWNGANGMGDDGYCNYGERRSEP